VFGHLLGSCLVNKKYINNSNHDSNNLIFLTSYSMLRSSTIEHDVAILFDDLSMKIRTYG